jgi:hypothetical protein
MHQMQSDDLQRSIYEMQAAIYCRNNFSLVLILRGRFIGVHFSTGIIVVFMELSS